MTFFVDIVGSIKYINGKKKYILTPFMFHTIMVFHSNMLLFVFFHSSYFFSVLLELKLNKIKRRKT
jgi:hypothetical protein